MAKQAVANASASLTLNTTEFSKPLGTARAEMKQFSATVREESNKSRESVRLLSEELSLGIPRGLQKIISNLSGVSTAMNLAFDGVVVFALIKTVVEVTEKIIEYGKKTEEAAKKNKEAWEAISNPLQSANDKMQVTNDKLEEQIAKLEHKPQNLLKTALDEAVDSADSLWKKLQQDNKAVAELLEKNQVGFFAQSIGKVSTDEVSGHVTDQNNKTDALAETRANNARSFKEQLADPANASKAKQKALNDAAEKQWKTDTDALIQGLSVAAAMMRSYYNGAKDLQDEATKQHSFLNYSNVMAVAGGSAHIFQEQADSERLGNTNLTDNKRLKGDQGADTAASELMKKLEDTLKQREAINGKLVESEVVYWQQYLGTFKQGSEQYLSVLEHFHTAQQAMNHEFSSPVTENFKKSIEVKNDPGLPTESSDGYDKAVTQGQVQQATLQAAFAATQAKIDASTGAISKHAEALIVASAHTAEYKAKISDLTKQLEQLKSETIEGEYDPQNAEKQQVVQNQIADLNAGRRTTILSDNNDLAQTNFSTRMSEDLTKWAEQATDLGNIMSNLFTTSIDQVNDAIIKILTEKNSGQHPFRQAGHAIFTDVSKQGLQSAEGSLMKLFGKGGKDIQKVQVVNWPHGSGPGGSGSGGADGAGTGILGALNRSNLAGKLFGGKLFGPGGIFDRGQPGISGPGAGGPINQGGAPLSMDNVSDFAPGAPGWVGQMTKYAGIALGAGLSSIEKGAQAPGDSGDDGDSAPGSGSTMQGIPITGSFQGVEAHASGGLLSANTWSLVGENGPELLPPVGQTTRVYDARDTAAMLGGGGNTTNHHWNVDARGSTDPAAVHAAVMRGIKQAAPQLISSAHASSKDHAARKPSSAK